VNKTRGGRFRSMILAGMLRSRSQRRNMGHLAEAAVLSELPVTRPKSTFTQTADGKLWSASAMWRCLLQQEAVVPRGPAIPVEELDCSMAIRLNNQSNRIGTSPVSFIVGFG